MSTKKPEQVSKILKLKKWLSIPDAAKHLAIMFGEKITEADVLQFALDGHFKLSINFVNASAARFGTIVPCEDVADSLSKKESFYNFIFPSLSEKLGMLIIADSQMTDPKEALILATGQPYEKLKVNLKEVEKVQKYLSEHLPPIDILFGKKLSDENFLKIDGDLKMIEGVWDLKMIGMGKFQVESRYHKLTGGPIVKSIDLEGIIVENQDGDICQLQESYDNNQFQSGSSKQLNCLIDGMDKKLVEKKTNEEILSWHRKRREKYEEEKRNKNLKRDFYPTSIPDDSLLVVRVSALLDFQDKASWNKRARETSTDHHWDGHKAI